MGDTVTKSKFNGNKRRFIKGGSIDEVISPKTEFIVSFHILSVARDTTLGQLSFIVFRRQPRIRTSFHPMLHYKLSSDDA